MIQTWIKTGARNLWKNRRRSLFTLAAVALSFTAVNLFAGLILYVFTLLQEGFVHANANGHLTILADGNWHPLTYHPADTLLHEDQVAHILNLCREDPRILLASPQLLLTGLASNGQRSILFAGIGRPAADTKFMQRQARTNVSTLEMFDGPPLHDEQPEGIGVSAGLAEKLALTNGAPLMLVATTAAGQMNAVDAFMQHQMQAPTDYMRDLLLDLPLHLAQSLADTRGADRVAVLLQHNQSLHPVRRDLLHALHEHTPALTIRTWQESFPSYDRLKNMFSVLFTFLFVIVAIISSLSIVNTISMAVLERTREIGTLRALGLKKKGVLVMFAAESGLLGCAGVAAGMGLTLAIHAWIRIADIQWYPPFLAMKIPLEIHINPVVIASSALVLIALSIVAALLPARRAAGMEIVDAFGHV